MSEPDGNFGPYFTAIGKVANAYSQLEWSVNDAIWELANISRSAGVCMTAQMIGPGPRSRCLLALLKFRQAPQTLLDEFNVVKGRTGGAEIVMSKKLPPPGSAPNGTSGQNATPHQEA